MRSFKIAVRKSEPLEDRMEKAFVIWTEEKGGQCVSVSSTFALTSQRDITCKALNEYINLLVTAPVLVSGGIRPSTHTIVN